MRRRADALTAGTVAVSLAAGLGLVARDEPPACRLVDRPVAVVLAGYPNVLDHAADAVRAGRPRVLHIARGEATAHRRQSLRGIPTRPGQDRDEYPPAVSAEGGTGASVRYVASRENRASGARTGLALRGFCDGQAFTYAP